MTSQTPSPRLNLVGADRAQIAAVLADIDPRPYRTEQVYHWVTRRLVASIEEMSNLSKPLRAALSERAVIQDPEVVETVHAPDGTLKLALAHTDGERRRGGGHAHGRARHGLPLGADRVRRRLRLLRHRGARRRDAT